MRENKLFNFYAVVDYVPDESDDCTNIEELPYYTISINKDDCYEYIDKKEKFDNATHYNGWCFIHKYKKDSPKTWEKYKSIVLENAQRYSVIKVNYSLKNLSVALRMLNNCVPIGCSYESPVEVEFFNMIKEEENSLNK